MACCRTLALLLCSVPATALGQTSSFTPSGAPALTLPAPGGGSVRIEPDEHGVLRVSDASEGPASALRKGDLVVGPATSGGLTVAALRDLVRSLAEGDSIPLEVRRDARPLTVYYRKPTAADLTRAGTMRIPAGAAVGGGGSWMTVQADSNAGGTTEMLEIAGNQIRSDEESGQLKVMMKVRDPDMAAVGLKALDRILKINGDSVADLKALIAKYRGLASGDPVTLLIERNEAQVTLTFAKPVPRQ